MLHAPNTRTKQTMQKLLHVQLSPRHQSQSSKECTPSPIDVSATKNCYQSIPPTHKTTTPILHANSLTTEVAAIVVITTTNNSSTGTEESPGVDHMRSVRAHVLQLFQLSLQATVLSRDISRRRCDSVPRILKMHPPQNRCSFRLSDGAVTILTGRNLLPRF